MKKQKQQQSLESSMSKNLLIESESQIQLLKSEDREDSSLEHQKPENVKKIESILDSL